MGSVCYTEQQVVLDERPEHEKQQIKISGINSLQQIRFQFSTDKLIHVSGDLLVLFMDHSINIRRNDHFLKLPMQGAKLQQHAKAYFERQKLKDEAGNIRPHFVTFHIIIPTLNFSKVSILFCNIWKEDQHNDTEFKDILREYFDSLKTQKIKSMVITEFTSELGVHLQKGVRRILREIVMMPAKPESIEFCCLSEESKEVFMSGVEENREDLQKSFGSISATSQSDYY